MERGTKKKNRPRWNWLIAVALLGVAFGVIWITLPWERPLLSIAKAVMPGEHFAGRSYCWLANDNLLSFSRSHVYRFNLGTGTKTEVKGLLDNGSWALDLRPSPNGNWLLWSKLHTFRTQHTLVKIQTLLTHLTGAHAQVELHSDLLYWASDNRHILVLYRGGNQSKIIKACLYDVEHQRITQTMAVLVGSSSALARAVLIAPDRIRSLEFGGTEVVEYGVTKNIREIRNWPISPPNGTIAEDAKISANGEQIAWLVKRERANVLLVWLHRYIPAVQGTPRIAQELWVSTIDGGGFRKIGEVQVKGSIDVEEPVSHLQWRNRNSLSFLFEGKLYTVDAKS